MDNKIPYDEIIDSIINDINDSMKQIMTGQYVLFGGIIHQAAQNLISLKTAIAKDITKKNETIELLKNQLKTVNDTEVKDGAEDGGC